MYLFITLLCIIVTTQALLCYSGGSVGNQFQLYTVQNCKSSQYCVTITPTISVGDPQEFVIKKDKFLAVGDFKIKACENENQESSLPIRIPISVNDSCKAEQCYRTTAEFFNATVMVDMCCCEGYLCNCSPNALEMDHCANATIGGNGGGSAAASSNNNFLLLVTIIVFVSIGLRGI